jgi:hypothetical protein
MQIVCKTCGGNATPPAGSLPERTVSETVLSDPAAPRCRTIAPKLRRIPQKEAAPADISE